MIENIFVSPGIHWLSFPEANLNVLCGCPADSVKHLMKKGLIRSIEKDGMTYESGPNAILLSDLKLQNGHFANLAEFPILQMLYRQGMLLPEHPNNTGAKPILIGSEDCVQEQMNYIFRGNYGLISVEEMVQAGIDKETAENINRDWLNFRPRIVFNQGRKPDDLVVIDQISETLERNLSLRCDYFGHLFFDPKASESLRRREPLKSFAPDSYIVADIDRLANRVIRLWSQPLRNSARLLKNNTVQVYEERYL